MEPFVDVLRDLPLGVSLHPELDLWQSGLAGDLDNYNIFGQQVFAQHLREGFPQKKIISLEFSMEGYPPPAPLPWKIINFDPTFLQFFVLWYNRPETHLV